MTSDTSEYNHASHWVSAIIDTDWPVSIGNPVLASIVWFGTIPNLSFLVYWVVRGQYVAPSVLLGQFFTVVWLNVGPVLIWYYDERVLPAFFEELTEIVTDDERIESLNEKYDRLFSERYWPFVVVMVGLILLLFLRYQNQIVAMGIATKGGPFFYGLLVLALWLGVLGGVGFMGVATTILAIREISEEPLNISPLHPDGLGGLGIVGYYAIRTTLTFSSGSLVLPAAFVLIRQGTSNVVIYLAVACYMGAIALSFLYPTVKINRQARRIRDENLDELRHEYEQAKRQMKSTGNITNELAAAGDDEVTEITDDAEDVVSNVNELIGQMELQRLRRDYEDYKNVSLYPFKIDILVRLISSVLLPVLFLVVDQVLYYNYQALLGL